MFGEVYCSCLRTRASYPSGCISAAKLRYRKCTVCVLDTTSEMMHGIRITQVLSGNELFILLPKASRACNYDSARHGNDEVARTCNNFKKLGTNCGILEDRRRGKG